MKVLTRLPPAFPQANLFNQHVEEEKGSQGLVIQCMGYGTAAQASSGSLSEMLNLTHIPDLLNQDMHFNTIAQVIHMLLKV